VWEELTITFVK